MYSESTIRISRRAASGDVHQRPHGTSRGGPERIYGAPVAGGRSPAGMWYQSAPLTDLDVAVAVDVVRSKPFFHVAGLDFVPSHGSPGSAPAL